MTAHETGGRISLFVTRRGIAPLLHEHGRRNDGLLPRRPAPDRETAEGLQRRGRLRLLSPSLLHRNSSRLEGRPQ